MTEQEFLNQKTISSAPEDAAPSVPQIEKPSEIEMYLPMLEVLKRPKRHLTAVPTFVPKSYADQIQFYYTSFTDGFGVTTNTYRVYFYFAGAWHYINVS